MAVIQIVTGHDCMGSNVATLPGGQAAGYLTGSGGIAWTQEQANEHATPYPLIWIDQSPTIDGIVTHADVFDVENGAITVAELPEIIKQSRQDYTNATRPGQRWPAVYCNLSTVTAVTNALTAEKLTGTPLWLAVPGTPLPVATHNVVNASGSFPIIGEQYAFGTTYDYDVWSVEWLKNVSRKAVPVPISSSSIKVLPPGNWEFPVEVIGKGIDGNLWRVVYTSPTTPQTPVKV